MTALATPKPVFRRVHMPSKERQDVMREEQHVFVFPSGAEAEVVVSRVAPGKFRIEENLALVFMAGDFLAGDIPDESGIGWLIEGDELNDGRLHVRRILEDPNVECVNGYLIPEHFPDSLEFQIFSDAIIAMEGSWEITFKGLFSAYVPRDKALERRFSLTGHLESAVNEWIRRGGDFSNDHGEQ